MDAGTSASTSDDITCSPDATALASASAESLIDCIIIIFNLALMYHSNDRASTKAFSLYQIATALASTLPIPSDSESLMLNVAVLNNFGIWCFENQEYPSMVACFEEMTYLIDESDDDVTLMIQGTMKYGIYRNMLVLLNNSHFH